MKLQHLPLSLFTITMGLSGFTIALRSFATMGEGTFSFGNLPLYITLATFCTTILLLSLKAIQYPKLFVHDWNDPVHINLFPALSISLILLSIAAQTALPTFSFYGWVIGTIIHTFFSFAVIKNWIEKTHFSIEHLNTLWFIPIVGNIIIPIMGVQFAPIELSWFFFALGFSFWLLLMPILMYRLIFAPPLPQLLTPSLFILVAPPAASFIAYHKLTHHIDVLAHILLYCALFFFAVNLLQALHRGFGKFSLSWWATIFPTGALATALYVFFHSTQEVFFFYLGTSILVGLGVWVAVVSGKTIQFFATHK